jgi:hypothetical protein
MAIRSLPGPAAGAPAKRNSGRAMADTDAAYKEAVWQLFNTISDEIEIARGAEQLAANLVDQATMEALAPARRLTEGSSIGAMDLLPLQVILSRHVASLEEILEAFNAL